MRMVRRLAMAGVCLLALLAVVVAFVYAGSPDRLAAGIEIAGVDVGGLSSAQAVDLLERREAAASTVPLEV